MTAVLLIGFGGPQSSAEVRPFLQSVLQGHPVSSERFEEVLRHYEAIGGVSPYNSITYKQHKSLEEWFSKNHIDVPVFVAFRHSKPSFEDFFREATQKNIRRVIGIILSSFRCEATYEKYSEAIQKSQTTASSAVEMVYAESFHNNQFFVEAQCERVKEFVDDENYFLFTAHSIPVTMARKSGYDRQFLDTAAGIAKNLNLKNWGLAYQSRSGRPQDLWLEPDIKTAISKISQKDFKKIVLAPIGFLAEHVEVIYDLDIEARKMIEDAGFRYQRCRTLMDHPKLIELVGTTMKGLL